jgi:formamidopyrimidine-DNA glycosylase
MPELPEVETIRRDLCASARGRRIASVEVLNRGSVRGGSPAAFSRALAGRRLAGFRRRGKYLIADLDSGRSLVVHLKMTGVLQLQKPDDSPPRAARIIFSFAGGGRLAFSDQRKFGFVQLVDDPDILPALGKLGPEPLAPSFTARSLEKRIRGRMAPIKPLLLDQSVVAGLGNIYACEALHRAGIKPQRPASSLSGKEIARLHRSIRGVLKSAIRARGSSVDTYRDGRGKSGWFQVSHRVYGRQGGKCRLCGCAIVRETLRGRGTYWCPGCQH